MSGDRFQPTADSGGGGGSGITQLTQDVLAGPGSGSVAATVVGLRTRGISATAPTNGQVLEYNSGTGLWTPTTPTSGGAKLYPPLDSHDLGYWDFSESSGNFTNQGTAAGVDLVPNGTPVYSQSSPLGAAAYLDASGAQSAATTALQPAQFTYIVFCRPIPTLVGSEILSFGQSQPVGPPTTTACQFYAFNTSPATYPNTPNTALNWAVATSTTSGLINLVCGNGNGFQSLRWWEWNMLAYAYDGTTYRAYYNGGLCNSSAGTAPDYASMPSPVIHAAGASFRADFRGQATMGFMRVRNVAMSANDIRLAYRSALAWA